MMCKESTEIKQLSLSAPDVLVVGKTSYIKDAKKRALFIPTAISAAVSWSVYCHDGMMKPYSS